MKIKNPYLLVIGLLVFIAGSDLFALDIYVLRHAQTMANWKREYTDEYQRTFSPWGQDQVDGVADKLEPYSFDVIIVSPAWRTHHTILPYLARHNRTAEIWPEVEECCWDRRGFIDIQELPRGPRIEIDEELQEFFTFRDEEAVYRFGADTPEAGDYQIGLAVDLIRERFLGTDKTILIVGHTHAGARIIQGLLDDPPPRLFLHNATLSHVALDDDGRFRLHMLNDEPVEESTP